MPKEPYLADEDSAMTETERHLSSPSSFVEWSVFGKKRLHPPEAGHSGEGSVHGYLMMDSTHDVVFRSPYGEITIRWAGDVLHSVALGPYTPFAGAHPAGAISEKAFSLVGLLQGYFSGVPVRFNVHLELEGHTHFERLVWTAARRIPYGEVRTYGWIASKIGKPGAARAVGGALGRNPFVLVVPCHRVVGADGKLAGFSAGLEWKRALLHLEGIETDGERIADFGLGISD